jgi:hypothetical protein
VCPAAGDAGRGRGARRGPPRPAAVRAGRGPACRRAQAEPAQDSPAGVIRLCSRPHGPGRQSGRPVRAAGPAAPVSW